MSSSCAIETLLENDQAAPQKRFHRGDGAAELACEFLPAPSLVVGQENHVLAVLRQAPQAVAQPLEFEGKLGLGKDVSDGTVVGVEFVAFALRRPAPEVDRLVAR
jgi:hypothetical protein